jgi:DNA-binding IclR family transcriptional regulator
MFPIARQMPDSTYRIGSLEKALLLLETIADHPDASLAELSRILDSPRAGVFRHLKALEAMGYVRTREGTKRYILGPRLIYLGTAAHDQMRLPEIARPLMVSLRDAFNETTNLGVLAHREVIHVEVVSSTHPVKMAVQVGERTYCHCSGLGKVILAWSEPEIVDEIVRERGLPALTEHTISSPEELRTSLHRIRMQGFAMDDEESALGLRCIAAPIRDETGHVFAALSLSSPAERLSYEDAIKLAPRVIEASDAISRRLGWFSEAAMGGAPAGRQSRA